MKTSKNRRAKRKLHIKILIVCVIFFILGYYLLNHVSTLEDPFLGNTFHILMGCILIAVSSLVFVITLKKEFFPKRRKRTSHVFLNDEKEKKS